MVTITFDDGTSVTGTLADFGIGPEDVGREVITLFTDLAVPAELQSSFAADFDRDGDVDGEDFLVWQSNLGARNADSRNGHALTATWTLTGETSWCGSPSSGPRAARPAVLFRNQ